MDSLTDATSDKNELMIPNKNDKEKCVLAVQRAKNYLSVGIPEIDRLGEELFGAMQYIFLKNMQQDTQLLVDQRLHQSENVLKKFDKYVDDLKKERNNELEIHCSNMNLWKKSLEETIKKQVDEKYKKLSETVYQTLREVRHSNYQFHQHLKKLIKMQDKHLKLIERRDEKNE